MRYPDFAYTKVLGVPLFAGFMYASVGSYIVQAWRLLDLRIYPNQLGAWSIVHLSKWSSWSLLVIMTFTIAASLKHIKAKIHIACDWRWSRRPCWRQARYLIRVFTARSRLFGYHGLAQLDTKTRDAHLE